MTMLEANAGAFMTSGGQLKPSLPLAGISAVPLWLTAPQRRLFLLRFRQQRRPFLESAPAFQHITCRVEEAVPVRLATQEVDWP